MIDEISQALGRLEEKIDGLDDKIDTRIIPVIEDYQKTKNRGIGVLMAVGAAFGFMGAAVKNAIAEVYHHIIN